MTKTDFYVKTAAILFFGYHLVLGFILGTILGTNSKNGSIGQKDMAIIYIYVKMAPILLPSIIYFRREKTHVLGNFLHKNITNPSICSKGVRKTDN